MNLTPYILNGLKPAGMFYRNWVTTSQTPLAWIRIDFLPALVLFQTQEALILTRANWGDTFLRYFVLRASNPHVSLDYIGCPN